MTDQTTTRRLAVRHEGVVIREHLLQMPHTRIGRHSDADIQLDDPSVSGAHAAVVLEPSPYLEGHSIAYLEDLDSTNGTQVNGEPIRRHRLVPGDVVRLGCSELVYEEDGGMDRTVFLLAGAEHGKG